MEKEIEIQKIHNIRYMGNKEKLLEHIIPVIIDKTPKNGVVCDVMSGTNTIGYSLNQKYKIISNDIQYYSYIIGMSLLIEKKFSVEKHKRNIERLINENLKKKYYDFFYNNYSDTYFSDKQCLEIDSIRYAIENLKDRDEFYNTYLFALMITMCMAQSTTGHFAQFLNKEHYRVKPLRKISIIDTFFKTCDELTFKKDAKFKNTIYNLSYEELFKVINKTKIDTFYLDPPYTHDQYSRFYHILETICKYDNPTLNYKAKYRIDRYMSDFCYTNKVNDEFEKIIQYCSKHKSTLIISYSNKGVAKLSDIERIALKYYNNIDISEINYSHSSQGKGIIRIKEEIITLTKARV